MEALKNFGDEGGDFTPPVLEFAQDLLEKRAVRIIGPVVIEVAPGAHAIPHLARGLVGEDLRLLKTIRRPAPCEECARLASSPELRKVHRRTVRCGHLASKR